MPKRKRLSEESSLNETPTRETQTTKTQTHKSPVMNGKQTPQSQKASLQTPKQTPKGNLSSPRGKKGTPSSQKVIHKNDDEGTEEENDEIVPNFNRRKSPENEEPASKRLKNNITKEETTDDGDAKLLFVKSLPSNTTKTQIKAWSKDILDVRFRVFKRLGKGSGYPQHIRCAFLEFESEAKADFNYKKLKVKKVGNEELNVDYVGVKSTNKPVKKSPIVVEYSKKKLFVAGLSQEVTKPDLEELFPRARDVVIPKTKKHQQLLGYAFIDFGNESDCKYAHDETQDKTLKGSPLVVQYSSSKKQESEPTAENGKRTEDDEESGEDDDESGDGAEDDEEEMDTDDDCDLGSDEDDSDDDDDDDEEESE